MDDYTIELAKETMEWVDGENPKLDDFFMAKARTIAAIAQAEATNRLANAAERQAAAVEKRNELIAEYNNLMANDLDRMGEQRERLLDIFAGNDLDPAD